MNSKLECNYYLVSLIRYLNVEMIITKILCSEGYVGEIFSLWFLHHVISYVMWNHVEDLCLAVKCESVLSFIQSSCLQLS